MRVDMPARRRKISRRALIIAAGALVVALVALGTLATFYTDLLWFREVKFTDVFWTQIRVKAFLGALFGLVFAAVLLVNVWVVQKTTSPHRVFSLEDQVLERYRATLRPYVRWAVVGMALLFGLFAGSGATSQWRSWLLFRRGVDFNAVDPLFHKDIGFYVFHLPFHRFVFTWAFSSLLVITLLTAAAHYFMGGIRVDQRGARATPQVKVHLSVLLGLMALLKAWGYRLDQFGLLYSPRGTVTGASYTDVHAQLPALKLLVIMAVLVAVLFFVNVRFRGVTIPIAGIGLLFLTSILAGGAYPALVQRVRVTPAERIKEAPFIQRNLEATRAAFNLSGVTLKPYGGAGALNARTIASNRDTVQNIRLWDPDVLGDAYSQLERIRPYYEFLDVDVDRYPVGDQVRQVMLAAREIDQTGLQGNARSWQNTHLTYTHGNGVVASRVDKVSGGGQPSYIVHQVPTISLPGAPKTADARIYFGESQETPYVMVHTNVQELDYPIENATTGFQGNQYAGTGGVEISGPLRRFAFAWRFRDANMMLSSSITGESRILFRRDIQERVQAVAPYLKLDGDPYVVMTPERLVWVQDAYTTTNMYPYSQRINLAAASKLTGQANYIRNSVKATIDAVDGTITLYVADPSDPIIRTWQRIFPANFKPFGAVPQVIRQHFRYPEDLFDTQAFQFGLYHITNSTSFYTREDAWDLPNDPGNAGAPLPSYYMLMTLPGEKTPEYILMRPFTPRGRKNMTAWLVARSDQPEYGKLIAYVLPKQRNALGPEQVSGQINADPDFSQKRTLLGTAGSQLIQGNLLVIPLGDALMYVQPFYLAATGTNIPELKIVGVVHGENVGVGSTLEAALADLFGGQSGLPGEQQKEPETGKTVEDFIREALDHFAKAQDALKRGDLATYAREEAAGVKAVQEAGRLSGATPSPSPSPGASPSPSP